MCSWKEEERKMQNNKKFTELSRVKIQEGKNIVVSKNNIDGGITIAQQIVIEGSRQSLPLFLKGAIHIDAADDLYNFRDALNEAIENLEGYAL
jgi:hypothetical protein